MVGLYRNWNADVMEFDLGKNTTSNGEASASMEVPTLQQNAQELTSKLADFDVSTSHASNTHPAIILHSYASVHERHNL